MNVVIVARDKFSPLPATLNALKPWLLDGDTVTVVDSGYPPTLLAECGSILPDLEVVNVVRFAGTNLALNEFVRQTTPSAGYVQLENDTIVSQGAVSSCRRAVASNRSEIVTTRVLEIDGNVHFAPTRAELEELADGTLRVALNRGRENSTEALVVRHPKIFERHIFALSASAVSRLGRYDEEMYCRTDIDLSIAAFRANTLVTLADADVTFNNRYDITIDREFADYRWNIERVAAAHRRLIHKWNISSYKNTIDHAYDIRAEVLGDVLPRKAVE